MSIANVDIVIIYCAASAKKANAAQTDANWAPAAETKHKPYNIALAPGLTLSLNVIIIVLL